MSVAIRVVISPSHKAHLQTGRRGFARRQRGGGRTAQQRDARGRAHLRIVAETLLGDHVPVSECECVWVRVVETRETGERRRGAESREKSR